MVSSEAAQTSITTHTFFFRESETHFKGQPGQGWLSREAAQPSLATAPPHPPPPIPFESKARPAHLLSVGVVDLQLAGPLAGQGPVADHQAGGGGGAEDGLAGRAPLDLTTRPLQLLQELPAVLCTTTTNFFSIPLCQNADLSIYK